MASTKRVGLRKTYKPHKLQTNLNLCETRFMGKPIVGMFKMRLCAVCYPSASISYPSVCIAYPSVTL